MKVANFPNRKNLRRQRALARMKKTDLAYEFTMAKIVAGDLKTVRTKKTRVGKRRLF